MLAGSTNASEARRTPVVTAVASVRSAVVNIRGQKTVSGESSPGHPDAARRVNGMGTGVIVDPRGYIVTCYHVVDGVSKIQVTLADGSGFVAKLVSRDATTDLAVIKVDAGDRKLPVINLGKSSDLMIGETVLAVGNAYGYEHTATNGIISALHRSVQVSDTQSYMDLIQTNADINPGNSGGPLINIDGEMIGINVAVRVGAQGIGFAVPVDKVMQVSADLLSAKRIDKTWHGVVGTLGDDGLTVERIEDGSPAATAGVKPGDVVLSVGQTPVHRQLDFERAVLGKQVGSEVELAVQREKKEVKLSFVLTSLAKQPITSPDRAWTTLGIRVESISTEDFRDLRSRYRGGLLITAVREDGPAAQQGIHRGDVLLGVHEWETISLDNLSYVLSRQDLEQLEPLKFLILREGRALYGYFAL
ncbi:MAG: trypsin-like peptidase domain-containing protein [Planctomycetes bacterium]|nr:trypsin-like peptidase domain-containing protein [Planctomycetota bacterium]